MGGGFARSERVAGQLRRELAQLIWSEVKDPRLGPVTVTDVEVSRDLAHAKVYVESADPSTRKDSIRALSSAAGFLRRCLGRTLHMRVIPELHFIYDDSVERGNRIDSLLASARRPDLDEDTDEAEDAGEDGGDGDA
ncbi:MAG: 30S ribosome-binding factor RbfA [Pseudomonadota bacterium]